MPVWTGCTPAIVLAFSCGGLIMNVCLIDIAEITGGRLHLSAMPSLDGELAKIDRIVLSPRLTCPGDVYWQLAGPPGDVQMAFFRGASGVVSSLCGIEPWPGRFSLQVDDATGALQRLVEAVANGCEESFADWP